MWCGNCQADVAAEVSPDNQRVLCALCGSILNTIAAPSKQIPMDKLGQRTKDARELLHRWSSNKVIDPFGPSIPARPVTSNFESASTEPGKPTDSIAFESLESAIKPALELHPPVRRPALPEIEPDPPASRPAISTAIDGPSLEIIEPQDPGFSPVRSPFVEINDPSRPAIAPSFSPFVTSNDPTPAFSLPTPTVPSAAIPVRNQFRIDAAHPAVHFASRSIASSEPSPEFVGPFASRGPTGEPQRSNHWFPNWDPAVWRSGPSVSGGWSSVAGQFLAYAGVLGLSAGACMVVWNYFGGPANYAPTGWLLATAGQMLLFFGVVSLVSGGLEQTTEQVNKRIEQLGDHIIRIEQAAREMSLRGGSVPPAHFGHESEVSLPARSASSLDERSVVEQ